MKVFIILISSIVLLFVPIFALQVVSKLILTLIVLSWLYATITKNKVQVHFEKTIIRGFLFEHNSVLITIANTSFLPMPMIAFRDDSDSLNIVGQNFAVFSLKAQSKTHFSYKIWSNLRGMYMLGPLHIASSDPLGLFPWSIEIKTERLIFIYPHFSTINLHSNHGLVGGIVNSHHPMYLDTTQLKSIHNYIAGDDPRHIHWKATAKTGTLQVSEYNKSLTIPFYLILNLNGGDYYNKRKSYHLERAIEAAAAFIQTSIQNNFSVGFLCNGTIPPEAERVLNLFNTQSHSLHIPITTANQSSSQILSMLSVFQFGTISLIDSLQFLKFQLNPRCIIITPSLDAKEFESIHSLIPGNCQIDFWFLDEHIVRDNRVGHKTPPILSGVKILKIPEYGDNLMEDKTNND